MSRPNVKPSMTDVSPSRLSLSAAIRQVFTQVIRLLEEEDPSFLLTDGAAVSTALAAWRKTVAAQTSGISTQRARELEDAKLEMMGRLAQMQKERDDLQVRNKELLHELVKVKKHEEKNRQQLLDAQFAGSAHKAEAKRLDLEIRELRRRVRELEGGPPLTAAEAAPRSKTVNAPDDADKSKASVGGGGLPPGPAGPSVQDRRAAAEEAFKALWKPKPEDKTNDDAEHRVSAAGHRVRPLVAIPGGLGSGPAATSETPVVEDAADDRVQGEAAAFVKNSVIQDGSVNALAGAKLGKAAGRRPAANKPTTKKAAGKPTPSKKARASKTSTMKRTAAKPTIGEAVSQQPTAKKATAKKPTPKKAATRKVRPKKKPTTKKIAAKKTTAAMSSSQKASVKGAATKKVASKKAAGPKKTTATKGEAKGTTAGKVGTKKKASKKAAAKKAPAKKAAKKASAPKRAAKKTVARKTV